MRNLCGAILAAAMLAAGIGCGRRGDEASFAKFDARARDRVPRAHVALLGAEVSQGAFPLCGCLGRGHGRDAGRVSSRGRFGDSPLASFAAPLFLRAGRSLGPCGEVKTSVRGDQNPRAGKSNPACGESKPPVRGERYPREPTSAEQQLATSNPIILPPLAGYDIRDDIWMFYI